MPKTKSGFTIVEILIVIVIVAVLATISTVAYNGVQARALNTARHQESKQWHNVFQIYLAAEGRLPNVPAQNYCLGSGFPNGDASPGGECRDYQTAGPNVYHETDNLALMNELREIASSLPSGPRTPINGSVGPYINLWSDGYLLTNVLQGTSSNDCPEGMEFYWSDGTARVLCGISFQL